MIPSQRNCLCVFLVGVAGVFSVAKSSSSAGNVQSINKCDFGLGHCAYVDRSPGWVVATTSPDYAKGYGPAQDHTTFGTSHHNSNFLMTDFNLTLETDVTLSMEGNLKSGTEHCLSFWYHMSGLDPGHLHLFSTSNALTRREWSKHGNHGDQWLLGDVRIAALPMKTRIIFSFVAERGSSLLTHIALDDISLQKGQCLNDHIVDEVSFSTPVTDDFTTTFSNDTCEGGFKCDNGVCIDEKLKCNGRNDCGDYSDEEFCSAPDNGGSMITIGSIAGLVVAVLMLVFLAGFRIGWFFLKGDFQEAGGCSAIMCCRRNSEEDDRLPVDGELSAPPPSYAECVTAATVGSDPVDVTGSTEALPPSYRTVTSEGYLEITHPVKSELEKLKRFSASIADGSHVHAEFAFFYDGDSAIECSDTESNFHDEGVSENVTPAGPCEGVGITNPGFVVDSETDNALGLANNVASGSSTHQEISSPLRQSNISDSSENRFTLPQCQGLVIYDSDETIV